MVDRFTSSPAGRRSEAAASCRHLLARGVEVKHLPNGTHDALTAGSDCLDGLGAAADPARHVAQAVCAAIETDVLADHVGDRLGLKLRDLTRAGEILAMQDRM